MACCGAGMRKPGASAKNPIRLGAYAGGAAHFVRLMSAELASEHGYKQGSFAYVVGDDVQGLIDNGSLQTYEDYVVSRNG